MYFDYEEKYEVGDRVIIKIDSKPYTGKYAGTVAKVINIRYNGLITVEAHDNSIFDCSKEQIMHELSYYINLPKCECGAHHTSFKNKHMFYCPLFKEVI